MYELCPDWADRPWGGIDYPMIPDVWQIKPINNARKRKILAEINASVLAYDGIVVRK